MGPPPIPALAIAQLLDQSRDRAAVRTVEPLPHDAVRQYSASRPALQHLDIPCVLRDSPDVERGDPLLDVDFLIFPDPDKQVPGNSRHQAILLLSAPPLIHSKVVERKEPTGSRRHGPHRAEFGHDEGDDARVVEAVQHVDNLPVQIRLLGTGNEIVEGAQGKCALERPANGRGRVR